MDIESPTYYLESANERLRKDNKELKRLLVAILSKAGPVEIGSETLCEDYRYYGIVRDYSPEGDVTIFSLKYLTTTP